MPERPTFGDTVRIAESQDTQPGGFAGRVGSVFGESVPSSSGIGPVIGDRGDDLALSVFFDDTEEQMWFAPHLVEFVEHGAAQTVTIAGGPTLIRDTDGAWHEVPDATPEGQAFVRAVSEPIVPAPGTPRTSRSWFRRRRRESSG